MMLITMTRKQTNPNVTNILFMLNPGTGIRTMSNVLATSFKSPTVVQS